MKFSLDAGAGIVVTGAGPGWIRVGSEEVRGNVVLTPDAVHPGFAPGGFDALAAADYEALLAHKPELVVVGTGTTQRFAHPRLLQAFHAAHVGIDHMTTLAACRTFNIASGEGRRVVAALIIS